MRRKPAAPHIGELAFVVLLLLVANAANVLAEGVQETALGIYAGYPGLGGRLVAPRSDLKAPADRAAQQLLITTAENAPDLETGWEATARAAIDVDPQGRMGFPAHRYAVVLTETHAEGRLHAIDVHPEDLEASLPVHPGPTRHESGAPPT